MSKKKSNSSSKSSSKAKAEALARAKKIVGKTATKSNVKELEKKGFSSKVIAKAVSKAPEVGKKAEARVDNKHTSSAKKPAPQKSKEAFARAQSVKSVIGNTATKSNVKELEKKGFSSKVIAKAVSKAPAVGVGAQARVENKHGASGGQGQQSQSPSQPKNVYTAGGTKVTWDPKKGRVHNVSDDIRFGKGEYKTGTPLTKDSRKEVNKMVNQGYSFKAPKDGKFNTVNVRVGTKGGKQQYGVGDNSTIKKAPNAWDSITLYQSVKSKTKDKGKSKGPDKGRDEGRGGSSSGSSSGSASPASNVRGGGTIYEPYSGAPKDPPLNSSRPGDTGPPSLGNRPVYEKGTLGAAGSGIQTHWSDTPERLADYSNRLDTYNRENIDWLGRRGEQQKASTAAELMQLAGAMPKQKEERNPYQDVLDFIKKAGA